MASQGFSTLLLASHPGCWLSLSACSLVLLPSACCSFRYLFCTSLLAFWGLLLRFFSLLVGGFCGFCSGVFGSSGSGASFLSWLRLSCLSPLVSFCCLRSSPDFWLFEVSPSFLCTLCVVLPAQGSLLRSFLSPSSSGVTLPSPTLFSYSRLIFWWHLGVFLSLPVFCCSCSFAGFCLSCPPLFAGLVCPTSASLSLLLGLLFHGPALWSPSYLLGGSLFPIFGVSPASGFAPSAATLLHRALLVAVASFCFFLCCWSACPADGSSGLRFLAVCSVYCSSFLVCRAALLFSVVCRLVWLGPPPALALLYPLESCSFAGFLFSFSSSLLGLRLSSGSSVGVWFGFSSGALFWWFSCRWSGHPLCVLPVCLAGCSWFSGLWSAGYLLASDRRSRFRVLFVLLRPSLSLSSSLIQPSYLWGLFLVGYGVCLWCHRPLSCALLSFFVRRLFVSLRFLWGWRPVVALSRFRGGVQLFCFP